MTESNGITLKMSANVRGKFIEGELPAALARCKAQLSPDSFVEVFDMSISVWQESDFDVVKEFLKEHVVPTVRTLNMDDVIASLDTELGLRTIEVITETFKEAKNLAELKASDNALGERAAEIMRPLFALPTLKKLSLNNNGMSLAVANILTDTLIRGGECQLTHLSLNRNQMGPDGASVISRLIANTPRLVAFEYAGCRARNKGGKAIMSVLAERVEKQGQLDLQVLDLADTGFGTGEEEDDSIDSLIQVLRNCPKLTKLGLMEGGFGSEGTAKVIQAMQDSGGKLQTLDFGSVGMRADEDDTGVDAFVEFVRSGQCDELEELSLNDNELENDGVAAIMPALAGLPKLSKLYLQANQIEEAGAQALADNKLQSLEVLDLYDNEIPEEQARAIVRMYRGGQIILDDDIITEEEEEEEAEEETTTASPIIPDISESLDKLKL